MTKKIIMFGLAAMLLVPLLAGAVYPPAAWGAVFRVGDNVSLDAAQVPAGEDVYAAGGTLRSTAAVGGDLIVAGGNLFLTGSTTQDVMAAGGVVNVTGGVGDDLRLVGGNLMVGAPVGGDVLAAGGQVTILPEARITGDLSVAAGQVELNGAVRGDAVIRTGQLSIGEGAVVGGKLTYYAPEAITVPAGAQILGGVEHVPTARAGDARGEAVGLGVAGFLGSLLMLFAAAWVLSAILGAAAPRLIASTREHFWRRLGWGFVTLIIAPILAVLLFVTVIGIPLGLGVLALYFFLLVLAYIYSALFVGSWILKMIRKTPEYETGWKAAALGALALTIVALIPVLGWLAWLIIFIVSFGAVSSFLWSWLRGGRRAPAPVQAV